MKPYGLYDVHLTENAVANPGLMIKEKGLSGTAVSEGLSVGVNLTCGARQPFNKLP